MSDAEAVIYFISCVIHSKIPDKCIVDKLNLKDVYLFASKHMLSAAVAIALESAGYKDSRSNKAIANSLRRLTLFEMNKAALFEKLEHAGIWYMPLKGAVLKDFYPKAVMREMSDYDILFDASRTKDIKDIMEELGFQTAEFGKHNEDVYYKLPVISFEMHRALFGARHKRAINEYYKGVKQCLICDTAKQFSFHFTPEDFYIYITAHEYSHYSVAGTGLRSLLDTYLYIKNNNLDFKYIETETNKLGILDFERKNRKLALSLFDGKELNTADKEMLEYIISSGTYGTIKNYADNGIAENSRLSYFLKRLTLPYSQMLEEYPILQKAPFLYPFCWLSRLCIRGVILRRKRLISQLKVLLKGKKIHVFYL